jgi:hypothetical protein
MANSIRVWFFRFIFIVALFTLSGCDDPVSKYINAKFPPVSKENQRQLAIQTAADALERMHAPNIAASIYLPPLNNFLLNDELKSIGVHSISLSGDDQLIETTIQFKRRFTESDTDNENLKKIFKLISPEFEGTIVGYMGITSASLNDAAAPKLELRLLPGVTQVKITNINIPTSMSRGMLFDLIKNSFSISETIAGDLLTSFFGTYRDNINGILAKQPFTVVDIKQLSNQPNYLASNASTAPSKTGLNLTVAAQPFIVPVRLDGLAWSVRNDRLSVVLKLSQRDAPLPERVGSIDRTAESVIGQVEGHIQTRLDVGEMKTSNWVAIQKELLAFSLNSVMQQAQICGIASGETRSRSEVKIPMPDPPEGTCTSSRNCDSSRQCSFSANRDTRNCNTCLVHRPVICAPKICSPWGGCIGGGCTNGGCAQEGNDPICEASKAAQNIIYDADANLRKADCDRLRLQEESACRVEVATSETLCNVGKAALIALKRTGNFANLDAETSVSSNGLSVCLKDFSISSGLNQMAATANVKGEVQASLDIKFTPLDIVGHLTCQLPWSAAQSYTARVDDSSIPLRASIQFDTNNAEKAQMLINLESTSETKLSITPPPGRFFTNNPQIQLSCSGLNFLSPLILNLAEFVPIGDGHINLGKLKETLKVEIPSPKIKMGETELSLRLRETPKALVYAD